MKAQTLGWASSSRMLSLQHQAEVSAGCREPPRFDGRKSWFPEKDITKFNSTRWWLLGVGFHDSDTFWSKWRSKDTWIWEMAKGSKLVKGWEASPGSLQMSLRVADYMGKEQTYDAVQSWWLSKNVVRAEAKCALHRNLPSWQSSFKAGSNTSIAGAHERDHDSRCLICDLDYHVKVQVCAFGCGMPQQSFCTSHLFVASFHRM